MNDTPTHSQDGNMQIKIQFAYAQGAVIMMFDPPTAQLSLNPQQARVFAINILQNAELALQPPQSLIVPAPRAPGLQP